MGWISPTIWGAHTTGSEQKGSSFTFHLSGSELINLPRLSRELQILFQQAEQFYLLRSRSAARSQSLPKEPNRAPGRLETLPAEKRPPVFSYNEGN